MAASRKDKAIRSGDVKTAVQQITPYLEDTSNDAPQLIYFNGWWGLGAPTVLRAIAEQPPQSLQEKFDKIIHIDCSIWKSRRALQRVIVDEIKLTQQLVAYLDRQDEEDDFSGVDHGSRAEIRDITEVIGRYLVQYKCLVIFHNGSSNMVDLTDFGIPIKFVDTRVLWTFRGRLRLNKEISAKVDNSQLYLWIDDYPNNNWNAHLAEEAWDIALHTHKPGLGVTPKIATKCCLYILSLNDQGKKTIDYKWATHASSYWVCDGIIGGQANQTWDAAYTLQQHIRLEDYSSNTKLMGSVEKLDLSSKQWISITESYFKEVPSETTTLFFASKKSSPQVVSIPNDKFHKADQLRVLKLCGCTFNFSSPPFHCCRNLRFLGLDRCTDELQQGEEGEKTGEAAVQIFQRLWVLDVCHMDWSLPFPPETEHQVVATDIREIHITNGRIWCSNNLAWRRLPNLHKLRVVEPTKPWETTTRDEFMDMVNLELLDLSRNNTIQVLPSLSGATGLKILVLDGCVGLEHVGPQGLPPSLESFSLNTARADQDHKKKAKISYISLAGCARLVDFILRGPVPNLEELDLSHTAVKTLDLGEVHEVGNLQRVFLMRCGLLRSISWPKTKMYKLMLLCIDTRAGGEMDIRKQAWSRDSLMVYQQDKVNERCRAYVAVADMRFLQSLEFLWTQQTIQCDKWNLCLSSTSNNDDGRSCHKDKMGHTNYSTIHLAAAPSLPKSGTYHDINIEQISAKFDVSSSCSSVQFLPQNLHIEIGEGISDVTDKSSTRARDAIHDVMNRVQSLHVHDNSSVTTIGPEHIFKYSSGNSGRTMNRVQWCRVERCSKLDTVFATNYYYECFSELEIFWATHLLMARSVWSRPRNPKLDPRDLSFTQLRAIHLHFCPRLRYVLPMASNNTLSKVLETLHIHCCGDLKQVFLMEQEFLEKIAATHEKGMLEFSNLKSVYLYELQSLQQICEAKMIAPKLETIYIRGCWGLRRLPATDSHRREDGRPVAVDCEKDWWDKLEWDGMESGHHPSLFEPSHSKYYKRRHLRTTVLR